MKIYLINKQLNEVVALFLTKYLICFVFLQLNNARNLTFKVEIKQAWYKENSF